MADEEKKVSFGFSKTIKKSSLQIPLKQEEKKIDYVECLDEKSIKVVGEEIKKDEELVIPMLGSKTWCDRILNKTDADIFEPKTKANENGETRDTTNSNGINNGIEPMDISQIKIEVPDANEDTIKTLEEQAAHEIIEDLKSKEIKVENPNLEVPVVEDDSLRGKQESTLEDYDHIPVDGFGLAVLRGMGWKPGKGIGKNEKMIASTVPELRPRGMGLGADKLSLQKQTNKPKTKEEEQLKIEKGSFVRIITGKHSNNYGQIEGFDDGAGRLIVKMALSGETLSLNENVVEPVTKTDFVKNSKVLNATKFEEYKKKTQGNSKNSAIEVTSDSDMSDDRETNNRRAEKIKNSSSRKKSKKHSKYSSDENSDSNHRSRKRKSSSSDSDYEYRQKKSKKSKKSHKRDSSPERSSKKSKKKDKERVKSKDRKTEQSQSSDRRQHKKHKRSRSRSPRRR